MSKNIKNQRRKVTRADLEPPVLKQVKPGIVIKSEPNKPDVVYRKVNGKPMVNPTFKTTEIIEPVKVIPKPKIRAPKPVVYTKQKPMFIPKPRLKPVQTKAQIAEQKKKPYNLHEEAEWIRFIESVPVNETVIMTVANFGYLDMLLNLYHSIQNNTTVTNKFCVLSYDKKLLDALAPYGCIKAFYVPYLSGVSSNAVSFKNEDWNAVTRFKLLAVWMVMRSNRSVLYVDPDIAFMRTPDLSKFSRDKMYIQQGTPWCSGVMLAHPGVPIAESVFDPSAWGIYKLDDEAYVRDRVEALKMGNKLEVFPFSEYPNGLMWSKNNATDEDIKKMVQNKECVLFHYNHISGINAKLSKMKNTGAYIPTMKVIKVPRHFKPRLADVCLDTKGTTYPPHHEGLHIEEACEVAVMNTMQTKLLQSEYSYLPVCWTSLAVANNPRVLNELNKWCKSLGQIPMWTVVQHCKGIAQSCGVELPANTKLFMTSDPNHIYTNIPVQSSSQPQKSHKAPPHQRLLYFQLPPVSKTTVIRRGIHINIERSWTTIPLVSSTRHICSNTDNNECRKYLASFMGNIQIHPIRDQLQSIMSGRSDVIIRQGEYRNEEDMKAFEKLMRETTFALCPRGYGTTSFRLTEAMEFGCIPVYISDVFSIPFPDQIKQSDYCLLVTPSEISGLYEKLKAIPQTEIERMRMNIKSLYKQYFTIEGCSATIISSFFNKSPNLSDHEKATTV